MDKPPHKSPELERIEQEAAQWVLRLDRGLTAPDQDAFSDWLAADPRHGAQLARHRGHWGRLDQLADWRPVHSTLPNPDLLAPPIHRKFVHLTHVVPVLAAAAAIAIIGLTWKPSRERVPEPPPPNRAPAAVSGNQRILSDGSTIELNRGASVGIRYSAAERRVVLERGEAHFVVVPDATRPFIVTARGVNVRAVGTAFNVSVDHAAVEVLVTEGRVQLNARVAGPATEGAQAAIPAPIIPVLEARQRAVVSLADSGAPPQIATLTPGEIERVLAWQHRILDFTNTPLNEIVAEFNRRNEVQLVLVDPDLAELRMSAAIRSDNVEGFVRLLEAGFGARAERRGTGEILLRSGR